MFNLTQRITTRSWRHADMGLFTSSKGKLNHAKYWAFIHVLQRSGQMYYFQWKIPLKPLVLKTVKPQVRGDFWWHHYLGHSSLSSEPTMHGHSFNTVRNSRQHPDTTFPLNNQGRMYLSVLWIFWCDGPQNCPTKKNQLSALLILVSAITRRSRKVAFTDVTGRRILRIPW